MKYPHRAEAEVDGVPVLALRDEDREVIADVLAEMLVDALDDGAGEGGAP